MKHDEGIYKKGVAEQQDSGVGTARGVQSPRSVGVAVLRKRVGHSRARNWTGAGAGARARSWPNAWARARVRLPEIVLRLGALIQGDQRGSLSNLGHRHNYSFEGIGHSIDHSIEAVHIIRRVGHGALVAIRIDETVEAAHHIAVPGLAVLLDVAGGLVVNGVVKAVAGGREDLRLLVLAQHGQRRGQQDRRGIIHMAGIGGVGSTGSTDGIGSVLEKIRGLDTGGTAAGGELVSAGRRIVVAIGRGLRVQGVVAGRVVVAEEVLARAGPRVLQGVDRRGRLLVVVVLRLASSEECQWQQDKDLQVKSLKGYILKRSQNPATSP